MHNQDNQVRQESERAGLHSEAEQAERAGESDSAQTAPCRVDPEWVRGPILLPKGMYWDWNWRLQSKTSPTGRTSIHGHPGPPEYPIA